MQVDMEVQFCGDDDNDDDDDVGDGGVGRCACESWCN